jgi:hypothetical protein
MHLVGLVKESKLIKMMEKVISKVSR